MTNAFISSCEIESLHCTSLLNRLEKENIAIFHSPKNDGTVHWGNWYNRDCQHILSQTDVFIIVITASWDSSTWMMHEALEAMRLFKAETINRFYYYNPENIDVTAGGMKPFLQERLPDNLDKIANILKT